MCVSLVSPEYFGRYLEVEKTLIPLVSSYITGPLKGHSSPSYSLYSPKHH